MNNNPNTTEETASKQFVNFTLDSDVYGLDIMMVEAIERITDITSVPKTPDYVLGVTNIRGDIIPVINLRKRLDMDDRAYDDKTRIIICKFDDYRIGIVVDMVKDVFTVFEKNIQMGKDIFKDRKNDFISKVIELQGDYILVLDLEKTLDLGE
ncbi:MAG: purine-binding chemotaxis protein CheW [Clostridiales bacterium]|nr:purine-binding chemotaxis protein CheW [Clostridiales bacterium]